MQPTIFDTFPTELALITEPSIYDFVTQAFQDLCPEYFWYIPASVGGHHPPICRCRGGLVHHTKLATAFADSFIDSLGIEDDVTTSQIIAGTLLHDMMKRGAEEDELVTWPNHREANQSHGRYCAGRLHEFLLIKTWIPGSVPLMTPIIDAVKLHMGRWTWEIRPEELYGLKHDVVVRTVHLADYCASRALHQYLAERAMDPTMGYLKQ